MRVWDFPPSLLCNKHLVAQHHEIHCIESIIRHNYSGFSHHPEVKRWRGHMGALLGRHEQTIAELIQRGMHHKTPFLLYGLADFTEPKPWQPLPEQLAVLAGKGCKCNIRVMSGGWNIYSRRW